MQTYLVQFINEQNTTEIFEIPAESLDHAWAYVAAEYPDLHVDIIWNSERGRFF